MDPIDLTYSLKNSFSAVRNHTFLRYNRDRTEEKAMPAHILVVEDDADQRSDLAEIVKSLGYQVTTAADGREALSKLAILPASAILTDLVMPPMDGIHPLTAFPFRCPPTPTLLLP